MDIDELMSQLQKFRDKRGNIPIYTPHEGAGIMLNGVELYVESNNENNGEIGVPCGTYCIISR